MGEGGRVMFYEVPSGLIYIFFSIRNDVTIASSRCIRTFFFLPVVFNINILSLLVFAKKPLLHPVVRSARKNKQTKTKTNHVKMRSQQRKILFTFSI